MTHDEMIAVIQAHKEGKQIECLAALGKNGDMVWTAIDDPSWSFNTSTYRVKAEPKYRPWRLEEVPVGAIVSSKINKSIRVIITGVQEKNHGDVLISLAGEWLPNETLLRWYLMLDGSPCGVVG